MQAMVLKKLGGSDVALESRMPPIVFLGLRDRIIYAGPKQHFGTDRHRRMTR
jgi:hypothetical protein